MTAPLDALAERYGIALGFHEIDGTHRAVSDETKRTLLSAFGVAAETDEAVARSLDAAPEHATIEMRAPEGKACFLPDDGKGKRRWGVALQVYQLRSARNWGIGDFADLAAMARIAAGAGADFVGTNPLHALFATGPERASPFFPSNRRFLNPLYIAVDTVPGFEMSMVDAEALSALRESPLVDYAGVAALKYESLRRVWRAWQEEAALLPERYSHATFARWQDHEGRPLAAHAAFEALSFALDEPGTSGWHAWPEGYRTATGSLVAGFERQNADEIAFHAWLQFIADRQLEEAATACREAGMSIGLYLDLAVGEAPDGSATWTDPDLAVVGAEIGAPPDYFTKAGQNWGLAGLSPRALRDRDMEPYRDLMSAVMRHAGAARIDHAMGVWQLYFIPTGRPASEGTYVRFPIESMLSAIAAESNANGTVIVGEDLGNVPEGFRDVMREASILSYRILYFEQDEEGFRKPDAYPLNALACLSTHDLPTVEGWWRGLDIDLRHEYGLIDGDAAVMQRDARARERTALLGDLLETGLIEQVTVDEAMQIAGQTQENLPLALVVALHRHLVRSTSMLAAVRIEDMAGEHAPVNLPGTVAEYPNWRRKLSVAIEDLPQSRLFKAIAEAVSSERPRT